MISKGVPPPAPCGLLPWLVVVVEAEVMDDGVAAAAVLVVGVLVTRVRSERGTVDIEVGVDVCNVVLGNVESARVEEGDGLGVVDGVATGVR